VPEVAKRAGAKRLAFCHYTLDEDVAAFVPPAKRAAGRFHYRGQILAPTDLDRITIR
jgi:hypothetical protein